eukprot:11171694-Lingulodinium_polyedra.AAC.1
MFEARVTYPGRPEDSRKMMTNDPHIVAVLMTSPRQGHGPFEIVALKLERQVLAFPEQSEGEDDDDEDDE